MTTVKKLTPDDTGSWLVTTIDDQHVLDLDRMLYLRLPDWGRAWFTEDGVWQRIWEVGSYPAERWEFGLELDEPSDPMRTRWMRSSVVRRIVQLPDMAAVRSRFAMGMGSRLDVQRGWWPLVAELDAALAEADPRVQYTGITQKFGGLRVHLAEVNRELWPLIRDAEAKALRTCERCGGRGGMHQAGGFVTLCTSPCAVVLGADKVRDTTKLPHRSRLAKVVDPGADGGWPPVTAVVRGGFVHVAGLTRFMVYSDRSRFDVDQARDVARQLRERGWAADAETVERAVAELEAQQREG
ncbi:Uncharacterised protein [Mycobacteroides abscessus subsp. abscessus]|nr:hypothetical protein [Mycobacteroides abscessus]SHX65586.1 Uncharacterised protein [Mycobacteroides abscessus subsp. abscessus]SHZ17354.1 Uncharacterised protein [Mycobacteroides abscessus subsp. abscessus]SIB51633.1 Uncharacterised protein [Mycobacteroides abscessus subsp. abscessus]SIF17573.1 Uncharacterised protein [Mycobacteroides abscessus subsp. abscessus]SKI47888.1 Uncharacterised protein [Mycobacteroides abscessus subsp. abscessus]